MENARRNGAYGVVHSFGVRPQDGSVPYAGLIDVKGVLYGTTIVGGDEYDGGVVFAIAPLPTTPSGTDAILHGFGSFHDGANPYAGLVDVKGTLYGTTTAGGANLVGTVFAIAPSGAETVLHSFEGSGDGSSPYGGLVDVSGMLYGTTLDGGAHNQGTVFTITPSGAETVLYSFGGGSGDGGLPYSGLTDVNGTLYGTTYQGGAYNEGTVFTITPSGAESVVHSFGGGSGDGAGPQAGVIEMNGTLYGTTYSGGLFNNGTVFAITPSGAETVLHSFGNCCLYGTLAVPDGANPYAGLVGLKGVLYGTTANGGLRTNGGTVFAITPSGAETVLHYFRSSPDGYRPYGTLIDLQGTLYGTTAGGGASGDGTIFALTPP